MSLNSYAVRTLIVAGGTPSVQKTLCQTPARFAEILSDSLRIYDRFADLPGRPVATAVDRSAVDSIFADL